MPSQIFQNYSSQSYASNWTDQQSEARALFCSGSSVHVTPLVKDKLLKKFEVKGAVAGPWAHHHLWDTSQHMEVPFLLSPRGHQDSDEQDLCQDFGFGSLDCKHTTDGGVASVIVCLITQ